MRVLAERIPGTQYAGPSWLPDGSGFFYARVADTAKLGTVDYYKRSPVLMHKLGTDPKDDPLLVQAEQKLIGQADELVVLCDSTKFAARSSLLLCALSRIHTVITDGEKYYSLPIAQDHKRLQDGDVGPNTGGMGTVAPVVIQKDWEEQIKARIVEPTLKHMKKRGFLYRGIVFIGIMVTDQGPQVIEYNTRFGDPETQVILPLLDGDTAQFFCELAKGKLGNLKTKNISATCVIMAASGYPEAPKKGIVIHGPLDQDTSSQWIIHAGTKKSDGQFYTNGGRVLGCVGIGSTIQSSLAEAYKLVAQIQSEGLIHRTDIGSKLKSRI